MFRDVSSEKELREVLDNFNVVELLNIHLPVELEEEFGYVKEEIIQKKIGLYDYQELRDSVFVDWGGENSLQSEMYDVKEDLKVLDKGIKDLRVQYELVVDLLSEMKLQVNAGGMFKLLNKLLDKVRK
jgi:hypothetical protein